MNKKNKNTLRAGTVINKLCAFALLLLCFICGFSENSYAAAGPGASFHVFWSDTGWSRAANDGGILARYESYPSAFKAGLYNQPEGMSGTIQYQVNLSGSGWLDWAENGAETGAADTGAMPLEAVRVRLNGDMALNYDIYTRVFQNGAWTAWVKNGETAGTEGIGSHIDGISISVRAAGTGEPAAAAVHIADPSRPMIALSFDDGPGGDRTGRILNALESAGGRATFFVVGKRINGDGAALLKRMADMGCEIGNHSYSHPDMTKLDSTKMSEELDATSALINAAAGIQPNLMRPPYGAVNQALLDELNRRGMSAIFWSIDTLDWKTRNADATVNTVLGSVKDGDIILMHDIHEATVEAALRLIPELNARGYQLVTVSELAERRGGLTPGAKYFSIRQTVK